MALHTGGCVDHRGAGCPSFYLDYHVGNGIVMQSQVVSTSPARCSKRFRGYCAPESYDALRSYVSEYWGQYITEAGSV